VTALERSWGGRRSPTTELGTLSEAIRSKPYDRGAAWRLQTGEPTLFALLGDLGIICHMAREEQTRLVGTSSRSPQIAGLFVGDLIGLEDRTLRCNSEHKLQHGSINVDVMLIVLSPLELDPIPAKLVQLLLKS